MRLPTILIIFVVGSLVSGCITVLTCEEAGHRYVGDQCINCKEPLPWNKEK